MHYSKGTIFLTSDEFVDLLTKSIKLPEYSPEELLNRYKKLVDKTPDKFFQDHFDWCIKTENYELAAYMRNVADERGIKLNLQTGN